jgi:hypothetical protein
MDYSREIENIVAFLKTATGEYDYSYGVVGTKEKEIQDLEHELELAATDTKARARVGRELQRVLKDRRAHKNIVECAEPVKAFMLEHPKLLNELAVLLGKVRKVEAYHATRQYVPRVRTDLTIGAQDKNKIGRKEEKGNG